MNSKQIRNDLAGWAGYKTGKTDLPKKVVDALKVISSFYTRCGAEKQTIQSMRTKWSK